MKTFKCIGPNCTDTCCAGWDINIDENTFKKYENDKGNLKELINGKYIKNSESDDSFNYGFMKITEDNKCPFLNENLLCEIHGKCGEENLSITCKRYPRVFNIIDDIYEKSGLPSCEEICIKAFLNKEKMEFIEVEEELFETSLEIKRVIDTEAPLDYDNFFIYFWDIRIISINIMQNRNLSIEERLSLLRSFYTKLENLKKEQDFFKIEEFLSNLSEDKTYMKKFIKEEKIIKFPIEEDFLKLLLEEDTFKKAIAFKLKNLLKAFKEKEKELKDLKRDELLFIKNDLKKYSYIFENYLVNQIFKDLIPFDKGENFKESIKKLINTYNLIKASLILSYYLLKKDFSKENIIYIIQALSKDLEHNIEFKKILE